MAINRSKISTLTDMGYSSSLAGAVLKMFSWDLPVAQAWLSDKANAKEIEDLKKASDATGGQDDQKRKEADLRALKLIRQPSEDIADKDRAHVRQQLVLLDLVHAPKGSMAFRLATVMARIEDLSHVLVWTASKVTELDQEVALTKIELPRLKLSFQPRVYEDSNGQQSVRLYCLEHAGLFLSDVRTELIQQLMSGLDYSLLMEDNQRELYLLLPNSTLHRPNIRASPFSTELVLDRGNRDWLRVMDTRYFLYPVSYSRVWFKH